MSRLLEIKALETGYGKKQVIFGLSLDVGPHEIVALIGPNGAGKSTVLKAVCGLIPTWKGDIYFKGELINGCTPAKNVSRGITFAPQGNRVFSDMTVKENLEIGGFQLSRAELKGRIDQVLSLLPALQERIKQFAGRLSGGEQQMVALARALIPKPKLLMLDEPSLGLAPNLAKTVFEKVAQLNEETGVSILIVEQKFREVLGICDRVYSLKLGKIAFEGQPDDLKEDRAKLKELFL